MRQASPTEMPEKGEACLFQLTLRRDTRLYRPRLNLITSNDLHHQIGKINPSQALMGLINENDS